MRIETKMKLTLPEGDELADAAATDISDAATNLQNAIANFLASAIRVGQSVKSNGE